MALVTPGKSKGPFFSWWYFCDDDFFFLFLIKDDVTEDEKDEADEKNRLISQVLELQNTLDGKQQYVLLSIASRQHLKYIR